MQILQVLCSFNLAFSDSRSSFGEPGAEPFGDPVLAFLLLEAASSRSSAEMEASSCSCWLLLLVLEVVVDELPGADVDDVEDVAVVAGEAEVLGERLTVLPTSSSTSILSSLKRLASSTLSLLLLP